MTSRSPRPGRWPSPSWARTARPRGCCGWRRAARPRTSRWTCCCAPAWAGDFEAVVAPLLVPLLDDELARDDAVAGLRRYSLISAPRDGRVSVHRLVQAITLDQLPAEEAEAWRRAAAAVIEAALPGDPQDPACWPVFAALLPHAQAALDPASDGMYRLAQYLGASGSYAAARAVQRQVLRARERDPGRRAPRHAHRPRRPGLLDRAGGGSGRGPGPVRRAAAGRRAGLWAPSTPRRSPPAPTWPAGPGRRGMRPRPGTSTPRCCRSANGSPAPSTPARSPPAPTWPTGPGRRGMRPRPGTSTPRCCRSSNGSLGAEHPSTLTARSNLARWTGEAGDPAGARDQYAALLPVRERVLGAEHPDTLDRPRQPGLLDRGGGGSGRGPGPVRRAAAGPRAGPGRRAPRHAHRPRQPGPLDQAGAEP